MKLTQQDAINAAAHWRKLADDEETAATYEAGRGNDVSSHHARARLYRQTADEIEQGAATLPATLDAAIWQPLPHAGHIRRRYRYTHADVTGAARNCLVELTAAHPTIPNLYEFRTLAADDAYFMPTWVDVAKLTAI